ncbi:peptidase inhibitor family I36 protein [Streptomyces sp. CRN 30]|uniref:peptidase inhibitor family I36 protein n=1 Tax=Streptomyces sp. CRN 30 TaxID=3075613 RepID=UPI002A7EFDA5|nr:peptidase inhibitor family I36 protein [Streptomyces sp. CRN 30]
MRVQLLSLAAGVVLVAAPPLATARPVAAAAASKCSGSYVCTWSKADFTGTKYSYNNDNGCYPRSGRSVSNQTGKRITVYRDASCYGDHFDIQTGHYSAKTPWPVVSMAVWG